MLYCVLTLSYIAVGLRYPNFPRFWQRVLAWSLILYASLLTLLVTVFDGQLQFTLFHISFNSGQWYALYQSYKLYRSRKNGQNGISSSSSTTSTKKKTASSFLSSGLQSRVTTRNQSRMEPLIKTFERGVLFYTLAILSWLTDMFLCEYLNPEYSSSVLPFNPQLHAWWHTFISIGLYHFVVFLLGERAHVLAKVNSKGQMQQRIKVMHWMGCVPYIVTETVGQQSRKRAAETTRLLNDF